ncbi:hypothetical protein GCM10027073_74250 [Streptomyces chlorus]|uniref:Uncharacterized protein n=1 Tax=Streptomyces chlorus TaxID=887452 RepID=A0ABW1E8I2_9ACTN
MTGISRQQPDASRMDALPTESWRPAKRRAFLGDFAPAFLDYENLHEVYGKEVPNAVLENVIGLTVCYDELWFLHRRLCPADMQDLDFVKFVSDDAQLAKVAEEVLQDSQRMLWDHWKRQHAGGPGGLPLPTPARNQRYANRWARHQPLRDHLTNALRSAGYACRLEGLKFSNHSFLGMHADMHQMSQWPIADALQLGPLDVIINSGSSVLADLWPMTEGNEPEDVQFEVHKVAALEEVLHLRSTDTLTAKGAYHEYIADLRKDKRIRDLREFLAGRPSPDGRAKALSQEVERLVSSYQREVNRRWNRPALLRTIGSMALSSIGNHLMPGIGVFGSLVNADRSISDFKFRRNNRWAAFVIDARDRLTQQDSS